MTETTRTKTAKQAASPKPSTSVWEAAEEEASTHTVRPAGLFGRASSPLAEALAAFQSNLPTVPKKSEAKIKSDKGSYSYTYASLPEVAAFAYPLLTEYGLSFSCQPRRTPQGSYELRGELLHVSGESRRGSLPLNGRTPQEIGSAITYARRYLLGCLTGIVTDEDDDAGTAQQAPEPVRQDHTVRLIAAIANLAPEPKATLREWWSNADSLPAKPENCTATQAQRVHEKIDEIVLAEQKAMLEKQLGAQEVKTDG